MKEDKFLSMLFDKEFFVEALEIAQSKGLNESLIRWLKTTDGRLFLFDKIVKEEYEISPPHQVLIPKDEPNEFRTVYVNEDFDRIFLQLVNDLLFKLCPQFIHNTAKAYQKGIGCGSIIPCVSAKVQLRQGRYGRIIGWKADLSKYFDSVPINFIDRVFDRVEMEVNGWIGSPVIKVIRKYYHSNWCFAPKEVGGELIEHYQSLKQGCAVASYLANALLYHIDEKVSRMQGYYVRYSDDILFIGKDRDKAKAKLEQELNKMGLKLNPKKVEDIAIGRPFKFLGFTICKDWTSLSRSRIYKFRATIDTIIKESSNYQTARKRAIRQLYGNGQSGSYCWATNVLSVITSQADIDALNAYVLDALRAKQTGKQDIGGLGYDVTKKGGCISRGKGRNVRYNRQHTNVTMNIITIGQAQKCLSYSREVFNMVVREVN